MKRAQGDAWRHPNPMHWACIQRQSPGDLGAYYAYHVPFKAAWPFRGFGAEAFAYLVERAR